MQYCLYLEKCSALRGRPSYHLIEKWEDDLAEICDFQGEKLNVVGFLLIIWLDVFILFILKNVPRYARGLYHLIEKWRDDLAKTGDFRRRKLSLV